MGFFDWLKPDVGKTVKDATSGVGDLIKDVRTAITGDIPPEKRADLLSKAMDIINTLLQYQAQTVTSEIQGKSWLQRMWRPLLMVDFAVIINLIFFGVIPKETIETVKNIPSQFWWLLTLGVTGYIGGRTVEKVMSIKNGGKK